MQERPNGNIARLNKTVNLAVEGNTACLQAKELVELSP
jgi:hypothetical protein